MDIFMPIALCVIFIILFTICGWCCKRKREGTVYGYGYGPSVTVTSTTQHVAAPQVVPPYPVDPRHPTPATHLGGPGYQTHQPPYPTHPTSMPFPQTGTTPYPPTGPTPYPPQPYAVAHDYSTNPPPYDVAVSQPPMQAPVTEGYTKQSPYNPAYN